MLPYAIEYSAENNAQESPAVTERFCKSAECISVGTINRWENAKTKPNITAMKKIKAFCEENDIPFDEIEAAWIAQKE